MKRSNAEWRYRDLMGFAVMAAIAVVAVVALVKYSYEGAAFIWEALP